jgi:selenocysteine lyase/cysteine desulfurase
LGAALDLFLEIGPEKVERYLLELGDYLAGSLTSKGYRVVSSRRAAEASAIVTCTHDRHEPGELYRILRNRNIFTAPRVGRLRISPHFYNTREEIDALVEALPG